MRCQVRERGCLCQEALTRAAYSPISSAGRRQRAHPAQPQARGERSPGKDQHVQPANYLPPSPFPAPNTNSLVLTLPEMAAVSVLSGRTSLSKCEPGCESRPLGTAQLSPQPEYAPRPEALQEGLTLKKQDWHFWLPHKAKSHPGTFQSMTMCRCLPGVHKCTYTLSLSFSQRCSVGLIYGLRGNLLLLLLESLHLLPKPHSPSPFTQIHLISASQP